LDERIKILGEICGRSFFHVRRALLIIHIDIIIVIDHEWYLVALFLSIPLPGVTKLLPYRAFRGEPLGRHFL